VCMQQHAQQLQQEEDRSKQDRNIAQSTTQVKCFVSPSSVLHIPAFPCSVCLLMAVRVAVCMFRCWGCIVRCNPTHISTCCA
jgi:hypothetical protein